MDLLNIMEKQATDEKMIDRVRDNLAARDRQRPLTTKWVYKIIARYAQRADEVPVYQAGIQEWVDIIPTTVAVQRLHNAIDRSDDAHTIDRLAQRTQGIRQQSQRWDDVHAELYWDEDSIQTGRPHILTQGDFHHRIDVVRCLSPSHD